MAAEQPHTVTVTAFRVMVVIAFIAHAIVLFALPHLQFLFPSDVMDLMRYGGHGARVAMNHPILYVLYLLPFPAFIGLFLLHAWGRYLLLVFFGLTAAGSFFFGASISGPPETFFELVAMLADGAILGLAFFSPPSRDLQPSNPTIERDGRQQAGSRPSS
jgi:hypothetical protein